MENYVLAKNLFIYTFYRFERQFFKKQIVLPNVFALLVRSIFNLCLVKYGFSIRCFWGGERRSVCKFHGNLGVFEPIFFLSIGGGIAGSDQH